MSTLLRNNGVTPHEIMRLAAELGCTYEAAELTLYRRLSAGGAV